MARPDVAQTLPDVMQVRSGQVRPATHNSDSLESARMKPKMTSRDSRYVCVLRAVAESGLFAGAWGL